MRKKVFAFILCLLLGIELSACSIPQAKPKEGIWYCEELMIEIDFSVYSKGEGVNPPYFAKRYSADGTCQDVLCHIDYGSGIWICSLDYKEDYLGGNFSYRNGVFSVTTREDKYTYVFERIDN